MAFDTAGQPLGRTDPSRQAADLLASFTKQLGPKRRISVISNSASVTIMIEERQTNACWKKCRSVQAPTAIDAIRLLTGLAAAPSPLYTLRTHQISGTPENDRRH